MSEKTTDILMITHSRPAYTRLSLPRLLETCDASMRVWVWHNGDDGDANAETLRIVESMRGHPRFHRFHHSPENRKLREPTHWLWRNAEGAYLSKVDDDCLVPRGWGHTLRRAHEEEPQFGVLGCWRFFEEDFVPEFAERKITEHGGGRCILRNCWIEGSGYVMKRACFEANGLHRESESFTGYCVRLAEQGWINGWFYPFLFQEHMDDPRSEHSLLRAKTDFSGTAPLTARRFGAGSSEQWLKVLKADAWYVQRASLATHYYRGWRSRVRNVARRVVGWYRIENFMVRRARRRARRILQLRSG